MKRVAIIGAGNIGSRHLQALKAVNIQLEISVIDPSPESLGLARERYESMPGGRYVQNVLFLNDISKLAGKIDLAIVATCADIRAETVRYLTRKSKVKNLVLEKLLFTKKKDYKLIGELLKKMGIKCWVNCPMRMMPVYGDYQAEFRSRKVEYYASWGGYGLMTSAIHYIDHMVYLVGSDNFTIDTKGLDKKIILSKRKGFVDLSGSIRVIFDNGSVGQLTSRTEAHLPILVHFYSDRMRCIVRETESKAWISERKDNWRWNEINSSIPYQSQLTTELAEEVLSRGTCRLTKYDQSAKIHLQLLDPVFDFLNRNFPKKYKDYPFT